MIYESIQGKVSNDETERRPVDKLGLLYKPVRNCLYYKHK